MRVRNGSILGRFHKGGDGYEKSAFQAEQPWPVALAEAKMGGRAGSGGAGGDTGMRPDSEALCVRTHPVAVAPVAQAGRRITDKGR